MTWGNWVGVLSSMALFLVWTLRAWAEQRARAIAAEHLCHALHALVEDMAGGNVTPLPFPDPTPCDHKAGIRAAKEEWWRKLKGQWGPPS